MDKKTKLEDIFQEIILEEQYDRLQPFQEPALWTSMSENERHLLGMLFAAYGEKLLSQSNSKAFEYLDLSTQVAIRNPQVLYQKAHAYASQLSNRRCLVMACDALREAVAINPFYFKAWCDWGNRLVELGLLDGDYTCFHEADQKFYQASVYVDLQSEKDKMELFWLWGNCWQYLGTLSGEAADFHAALEKYRIAASLDLNAYAFWNDYGDVISELANLLGRKEFLLEAIELYKKALLLAPEEPENLLNLSYSYQRAYEFDKEDFYYTLACESFEKASEANKENFELWLNWGRLLAIAGKERSEISLLYASCEKYSKANVCEPNHLTILTRWAEAEMLCGSYDERLDLLRTAEEKAIRSLELCTDDLDAWYIYGTCLSELGRYFSEASYYYQAIEKFQYSLSLNQRQPMTWYRLALAYFALGEMDQESEFFEKANFNFSKVLENGGTPSSQFWNDWGVVCMQLGEANNDQNYIELAIDKLQRAIDLKIEDNQPIELEWQYNYGCAFDFLGNYTEDPSNHEKAIHELAQVLEQDPTYPFVRYNLAVALSHLAELNDDVELYQKSLEHFQIALSEDAEDEMAWNDWGMTQLNLTQLAHDSLHPEQTNKSYQQVEEKFMRAIALGSTVALYSLACLYSLMRNFHAAMHYIERAEIEGTLPCIEDLMHDEWLEGLRETADFRHFISIIANEYEKEKP